MSESRRAKAYIAAAALVAFSSTVASAVAWMTVMPGTRHQGPLPRLSAADEEVALELRRHVQFLAGDVGPRSLWSDGLDRTVEYIEKETREMGWTPGRSHQKMDHFDRIALCFSGGLRGDRCRDPLLPYGKA
jgi:hypothetical protein